MNSTLKQYKLTLLGITHIMGSSHEGQKKVWIPISASLALAESCERLVDR